MPTPIRIQSAIAELLAQLDYDAATLGKPWMLEYGEPYHTRDGWFVQVVLETGQREVFELR